MNIPQIQRALRESKIAGWLIVDFRNRDPFARKLLGLNDAMHCTRRWYYYIPQKGAPTKIVSAVEPALLNPVPGKTRLYRTWKDLHVRLREALGRSGSSIALQYSSGNEIPYLSTVDAGTIELLRSFGYRIVTAAPFLHAELSAIDEAGYRSHIRAGKVVDDIRRAAFERIARSFSVGRIETEYTIQQFILREFKKHGLTSADSPMVGVNAHPANPHFEVSATKPAVMRRGDTLLIDLWAKFQRSGSIYYDSTWVGFIGTRPPRLYSKIWEVVRDARDAAIERVLDSSRTGRRCRGSDVDDAARAIITKAGFGKFFIHRTGHSITESTHGEGVNMDNFETSDTRELLPGSCFSIEPGIYLPNRMAVRSEINMFIKKDGAAEVTGEVQRELVLIDV